MTNSLRAASTVKHAVIYARFSTDRQDARSIDDQTRRCTAWAAQHGYEIVGQFADEATSGSHMEREGIQRLLAETRKPGGSPFAFVIVDDLSRLSRDLGDMWRVVFGDLLSDNVTVIDSSSGALSTDDSSEMQFGTQALFNAMYIKSVRRQTHRGLEGRALQGFSTGGRTYGYVTENEPNPSDPLRPKKVRVVHEAQTQTVRRVFELYAAGMSQKKIAALLNSEGLASPYDDTRWRATRRGWSGGTIRAMLLNRLYIGEVIWNRRQYASRGGKKTRKATKRPETDVRTFAAPHLRILPQPLWEAVQARFKEHKARGRGRHAGSASVPYLLSGILRCGSCGGAMAIASRKVKAGRTYANYACAAFHDKGEAICANGLHVSERKAVSSIVGAIRDLLADPKLVSRFIEKFNARVREARDDAQKDDAGARDIDRQIVEAQRRVGNLMDAITKLGLDDDLAAKFTAEKAALHRLRAEKESRVALLVPAAQVPDASFAQSYLDDLLASLEATPDKARSVLAKHLGKVLLTPKREGDRTYYVATGGLNISVALGFEPKATESLSRRVAGARKPTYLRPWCPSADGPKSGALRENVVL